MPLCICNAGYHVDAEDLTKCVENDPVLDPCAGITCNDKGICAAKSDNTPICICNAGYHVASNGTECELDADGCKDVDCGHGTCFNANGVGVCLCEQGYHAEESKPDLCVENDPAPNPCEGQTCSGHGACVIKGDGSNEATCLCETNYINDGLSCINDDANNNYMLDKYETASDQGKDCSKTYQAGCTNFCDSFLNNHCSTKCTSDEQCINDDYFCRNDGRCAPKVFETVWTTDTDDQKIYFPGGSDHCNYRIDWGDGSSESFTKCASAQVHTYSKAGTYHVKVTGVLEEWSMSQARRDPVECETLCQSNLDNPPEYELEHCIIMCMDGHASHYSFLNTASLTQVVSFGPVKLGDSAFTFQDALTKVSEIDIPDLSGITSLNLMFDESHNFNSNLNRWDTSTITAMSSTFGNCEKFNSPLNNWDTTHVTDMSLLFFGAESFKGNGLSEWQTPVLTNLHYTFYDTPQFDVNLSGWNVTKVTSYSNAFQNSGISQATWNDMVSKNAGWASLDKSTLGISY
ncbi:MAG: BspA family leucine-rich repeat surface protein [Proteobacteria bacterium]|nr:BspA family leucine-rich repeat surface protein [Pseudomonadota bacterium]